MTSSSSRDWSPAPTTHPADATTPRGALPVITEILRLSLSLVRIPRLFATLFLFPLLVSFLLVLFQATATISLVNVADSYESPTKRVHQSYQEGMFIREKLLGVSGALPPIRVCRWETGGEGPERAPTSPPGCSLERYDVVLKVEEPASFDPAPYQKRLDGKFLRLHICKECRSDIIITPTTKKVTAHLFSVQGLILLSMARRTEQAELLAKTPDADPETPGAKLGKDILNLPGLYAPTPVADIHATLIGILNVASLIIIAAWLAMKSHRKVLDYFAASGALLPLVAASGRAIFTGPCGCSPVAGVMLSPELSSLLVLRLLLSHRQTREYLHVRGKRRRI